MDARRLEKCFYCNKTIHTMPFRIRPNNKNYQNNHAHYKCLKNSTKTT